ncbi:MAG: acetyl-CoA acetyltransferase [Chloroflexota bacterium]|nr:acetyl-CoA acetyltransferase [Chloroflexota bacterium]
MAESMKDKIAVIGMGCSQVGELWNMDADDLIVDATYKALADAGVELKNIEAAWVGVATSCATGASISSPLQLQYIPVTRVENACATGTEAIRNAAFSVIAKVYDLVLVVGYEKLKDSGFGGLGRGGVEKPHPVYGDGQAVGRGPGHYALTATRYFHRYGLGPEEGKGLLAKISVKSHYNGFRNPSAHLRREVSLDTVINAPIISWPLGLYDCCGVTDGAAAAIICRTEDVKTYAQNHKNDYITIKGIGISIGPGWGKQSMEYDFTHWEETERATAQAYKMAGITDPRRELDLAEVHDCFSISELIVYESAGYCEKGKAKDYINGGAFIQADQPRLRGLLGDKEDEPLPMEGQLPVNISGGLKSFGHPVGASGCRELYEIYTQIQGKAELPSRQLKTPKLGMTHNQGGHPGKFMCSSLIAGLPE